MRFEEIVQIHNLWVSVTAKANLCPNSITQSLKVSQDISRTNNIWSKFYYHYKAKKYFAIVSSNWHILKSSPEWLFLSLFRSRWCEKKYKNLWKINFMQNYAAVSATYVPRFINRLCLRYFSYIFYSSFDLRLWSRVSTNFELGCMAPWRMNAMRWVNNFGLSFICKF
jgi:hypothetical protein